MFFLKKTTKAAVIQSRIIQADKEVNMKSSFSLFNKAIESKPQIVCFTQAFASGLNFITLTKMAERIPDGNISNRLSEEAVKNKVFIAAGILEIGDDNNIYDSIVLFSPKGDLLAKYRRWLLWHGERNYISQGCAINVIETDIGRVGLMIGYDLCFPEGYSHYAIQEIDILICSGSIFRDLSYNVQQLCSTRAMDLHCYLLFSSAIGEHQFANMHYMGNSAITCDPYFMNSRKIIKKPAPGCEILAKAGSKEEVIVADLYLDELSKSRKQLPFVQDLRRSISHATA